MQNNDFRRVYTFLVGLIVVQLVLALGVLQIPLEPIDVIVQVALLLFCYLKSGLRHSTKALERYLVVEHQYHHFSGPLTFFSGLQENFEAVFAVDKEPVCFITHAAIKHPSGMIYAVLRPGRHHHVIEYMSKQNKAGNHNTRVQGFITNHGTFVDRYLGCEIARAANQIIRKHGSDENMLFSEDLWESQLADKTVE